MDSVTSALSAISLAASKPPINGKKIAWPDKPFQGQSFSLPSSIIYYVAKNPLKPDIYLKLAKSCKYFFEKNPLLIIKRIEDEGKRICSNTAFPCRTKKGECCVKADIQKLSSRIWFTGTLKLFENSILSKNAALLIPKLYHQFENAELELWDCKMIFDDFKLLATKFQKYSLANAEIVEEDGKHVLLEKIIESIAVVKEFTYHFEDRILAATTSTVKTISQLKNLGMIRQFYLTNIPGILSLHDLTDFIKTHKDTKFWFEFHWNLAQEYKQQLNQLIDMVIASKLPNRLIFYPRQNPKKYKIMRSRFSLYD